MIYQGSKRRIAKDILPYMTKYLTGDNYFIDLFTGGGNLVSALNYQKIIANDLDSYVISTLKKLQESTSWLPCDNKQLTKEQYIEIQNSKDKFPKYLVGLVGYHLSYGGKWFGGYRADKTGIRDYINEGYKSALKQHKEIQNIQFTCKNYSDVSCGTGNVIYCDIPYRGTTKYKGVDHFDYEKFYAWCKEQSKYNKVFISEYNMPSYFRCVWKKEVKMTMKNDSNSDVTVEKLYTLDN
jgi:DNA adenine methylase